MPLENPHTVKHKTVYLDPDIYKSVSDEARNFSRYPSQGLHWVFYVWSERLQGVYRLDPSETGGYVASEARLVPSMSRDELKRLARAQQAEHDEWARRSETMP